MNTIIERNSQPNIFIQMDSLCGFLSTINPYFCIKVKELIQKEYNTQNELTYDTVMEFINEVEKIMQTRTFKNKNIRNYYYIDSKVNQNQSEYQQQLNLLVNGFPSENKHQTG